MVHVRRQGQNKSTSHPKPLVFQPSKHWEGNDGPWSSFMLRIGTPEQSIRVFPSTVSPETWVPVPEGCVGTDPSDCGARRGIEPFNGRGSTGFQSNISKSWELSGIYDINLEKGLGITGFGKFGFDKIGFGYPNTPDFQLEHQILGGIAIKDYYLGVFGLSPRPTNFSSYADPQPSFMASAKKAGLIPSLSFGYTAGAPYRESMTSL